MYPSFVYNKVFIYLFIYFYKGPSTWKTLVPRLGKTHIPSDICSPTWETHIPRAMCSLTWKTHTGIPSDVCSLPGKHISLLICVPLPGKHIS